MDDTKREKAMAAIRKASENFEKWSQMAYVIRGLNVLPMDLRDALQVAQEIDLYDVFILLCMSDIYETDMQDVMKKVTLKMMLEKVERDGFESLYQVILQELEHRKERDKRETEIRRTDNSIGGMKE